MAQMVMEEDVVIVGGGIAGLATALGLKRVGIRSLVLEKSNELRTTGASLSLASNAWIALKSLGVDHKLAALYAPLKKGRVTDVSTGTAREILLAAKSGPMKEGVRAVHRRTLLEALAEELPADSIRYCSKLASITTETQADGSTISIVHLQDGTIISTKVLIGCDGVHSVVSKWLGLSDPVESGRWAVRGLSIFPTGHELKTYAVEQFLKPGIRAGMISMNDREVYWFFTSKYSTTGREEKFKTDPVEIQRSILDHFAKDFPESYKNVVKQSDPSSLSWAPLLFRYPQHVLFHNLTKDNITVAGDAMHPMTPDLGQGGSQALEDAVVLSRHIGLSYIENGYKIEPKDVPRALKGYVKERKWRVTGLIIGSYISGAVQGNGSNWFMKLIRTIFYMFVFKFIFILVNHDCGKLPVAGGSSFDDGGQTKKD